MILLLAILVGVSGCCCSESLSARTIEVISVYYTKEIVNDQLFEFREDRINGVIKKSWTVDGVVVRHDAFLDAVVAAEMVERKNERRVQEEKRVQALDLRDRIVHQGYQKIARTIRDDILQWITKIEDNRISHFVDEVGVQKISSVRDTVLVDLDTIIDNVDKESAYEQMQKSIAQAELVPQQLHDLFYELVQRAIARCNDTKVLKELLDMVAQQ